MSDDIIYKEGKIENAQDVNDESKVAVQKEENAKLKEQYKSSVFILEYVYKEYTRENERRKNIESRIPILMTLSTFFGGAILINNKIDFLKMLTNGDKRVFLLFSVQLLSCLCLLGAIGIFVSILVSREYISIKTDSFCDIKPQGAEKEFIAYDLLDTYKECLDFNTKVNNFKYKINNIGIYLLITSIILYLILSIINTFI
jgi:hypothetical protein